MCVCTSVAIFLFFFFSSRRRHTRCYRDWSSDVCSSDLQGSVVAGMGQAAQLAAQPAVGIKLIWLARKADNGLALVHQLAFQRSARQEAQPARALPPAARVCRDDTYAPAMRQPQAERELLQ